MSVRRCVWLAMALVACLSGMPGGQRAEAAPLKLLDVAKSVDDDTHGKQAMADLAALPLKECTTVEYHVALGRAARHANAAAQAAEASATAGIMPAQVAPSMIGLVSAEMPVLREWLRRRADDLYEKSGTALAAGDRKTAVKAYLVAVKCDPAVLTRDDRGLGKLGMDALRALAAKHPEKAELAFQLGYYSWIFGDAAGAITALQAQQRSEKDAYKLWRGKLWLQVIQADVARSAGDETSPARPGGAIQPVQTARK